MAPPKPYTALFVNRRLRRRFARSAPQAALRYSMGPARALARRGPEGQVLTVYLDVINAVGFRGGAGTAEAMPRAIAAGEGNRVVTLICRKLYALRQLVEENRCFSNNNMRHLRQTTQALNAAAAEEEEEEKEEEEEGNESSS